MTPLSLSLDTEESHNTQLVFTFDVLYVYECALLYCTYINTESSDSCSPIKAMYISAECCNCYTTVCNKMVTFCRFCKKRTCNCRRRVRLNLHNPNIKIICVGSLIATQFIATCMQ
jgi:hypothetical protein